MESHNRVIIHIDIDCFYAQVEMNRRPDLRQKPLGVQQKNIVVTCNYPARAKGIGKCMGISKAMEVCPELELVNGEDLAEYRRVSAAVNSTLCETGSPVERLGMDENWLDITQMVEMRLREAKSENLNFKGEQFGELKCDDLGCDCVGRLIVGTLVADELRAVIKSKYNLTTSAGIAHNKLLAKLVGSIHKPNNQTVIASSCVTDLIKPDHKVTTIPGIGKKSGELLAAGGITTIQHLRDAPISTIISAGLQSTQAETMKQLCFGIDSSDVKMSGRPASVGLEDRFVGIYTKQECREKLVWLLGRLVQLLVEDGRKPSNIKVTVRDYYKDKLVKKFSKESRQIRISPRLFHIDEEAKLKEDNQNEIIEICLGLLGKIIDFTDAFHITLMGISVTDFQDHVEKKSSIKNFFISPKKSDVPQSFPTGKVQKRNIFPPGESKEHAVHETKKKRKSEAINISGYFSKSSAAVTSPRSPQKKSCPKEYDQQVWATLPSDIKEEILRETNNANQTTAKSDGFIETSSNKDLNKMSADTGRTTTQDGKIELKCPVGCDPQVFSQLPDQLKLEVTKDRESRLESPKQKICTAANTRLISSGRISKSKKTKSSNMGKKNSILNYFSNN